VQTAAINVADLSTWIGRLWWPVLRISGFVVTAPIAGEKTIPPRIKIVLTLALTMLLAPLSGAPGNLSIFSAQGALTAVQELLIGASIGLVVTLAFEALTLAGQTVSMTMGLGFATLVDPQRGANSTVVGQTFTIFAMLAYLAIDGHLVLLAALANSFQTLPIGGGGGRDFLESVVVWGGRVFEAGLLIALPAVIALVIVNLALGVVTRAAPQLNLWGVGFPLTLLTGFIVLYAGFDGILSGISSLLHGALAAAAALGNPPSGRVP
jgi:flagellar biosynthetic protein FliR